MDSSVDEYPGVRVNQSSAISGSDGIPARYESQARQHGTGLSDRPPFFYLRVRLRNNQIYTAHQKGGRMRDAALVAISVAIIAIGIQAVYFLDAIESRFRTPTTELARR